MTMMHDSFSRSDKKYGIAKNGPIGVLCVYILNVHHWSYGVRYDVKVYGTSR